MSNPLTEQDRLMFKLAGIKITEEFPAKKIPALEETVKSNPQMLLEGMRSVTREILTELDEQEKLNEIMYRRAGLKR